LPVIPTDCKHNAHMFYIKVNDLKTRTELLRHLHEKGITAAFHYIPLHSSPAGRRFSTFTGQDIYTTKESERLIRLPMFYGLEMNDIDKVCGAIYEFFI